jgi:hypothetical protein
MKRVLYSVLIISFTFSLSSCGLWHKIFKPKYGCPSNGKNVGAEKILSGDKAALKSVKKAKKFKMK